MNDKIDSLFEKTEEKIGENKTINLKGSDVDSSGKKKTVTIPAKGASKPKTQRRTKKLATYITASEYEAFASTFAPLEKVSDRIRDLIIADTKKRRNTAVRDGKVLSKKDVWVEKKVALAKNSEAYLKKGVWVKVNESFVQKWMVKISIGLNNKEAMAFAEFLKKVSFVDYRNNAKDDDEAYLMQSVWVKINECLAEKWTLTKRVRISIALTDKEAMAFAEFLKRVHFINYRNNAKSDNEAYLMQDVWFKINKALAEKWFDPR